jgi:hypothetical protein
MRCSPAPPGLRQVLQDGPGLILLHPLRHHVQNVMLHNNTTQSHTASPLANLARLDPLKTTEQNFQMHMLGCTT